MRRSRLIASDPYLRAWLNDHPMKNDPEAPLWIKTNNEPNNLLNNQQTNQENCKEDWNKEKGSCTSLQTLTSNILSSIPD